MANALPLPDGRYVTIRDGETPEDTWARAQKMYPEAFNTAPAAPQGKPKSSVADLGYSALSGIGSLVQFPGQVYGLATGDMDNSMSKMGQSIQDYASAHESEGLKARKAAQQAAIEKAGKEGVLSEAGTAISSTLKDPVLFGNFIAENIPNMIPGFGATRATLGVGVRMAAKQIAEQGLEGEAKKVALDAAREALTKKAEAAAVGVAAAQQGADVGAQAYTDIYAKLKDQGASDEDAAAKALSLARASGASGAVISLLSTKLPGARALEESFAGAKGIKGTTTGALKGLLGEGASEAVEEGGGALARNAAMATIDPTQNIMQGVGSAAGQGALLGGAMGAGAGMLNSRRETDAAAQAAQQKAEADAAAAEQAKQAQEADIAAKRADPNFIAGLINRSDQYREQIDALKAEVKNNTIKNPDALTIAKRDQAATTLDDLMNSPAYLQHKETVDALKPEMNAARIQAAKEKTDAEAAAKAETEAKLADPVLQKQLHGQFQDIGTQMADTRNKIDTLNRNGDHAQAIELTKQFADLQKQREDLQGQLGPRPQDAVTPAAPSIEAMQTELQSLIGTTTRNGFPKAGKIMQLLDAGDTEGSLKLQQRADELRAAIAEPTRARDAVQRQIDAYKTGQQTAPTTEAPPAPTAPAVPPENLSPEAAKQWLLDRKEAARDAQRTPLNPDFTEQRTLPLSANPVQYTSAATVQRREQTLEGLKNEFGALVRSARVQRVQGKVPQALQEQITAKADEIRDFQNAVARQDVPRGQATAEVAPALAGTQRPETLPRSQSVDSVERTYTPEKATEEAVREQLGGLPEDLPPQDDALVQQITNALPTLKNAGEAADTMSVPAIEGVPYDRVTADLAPTRALEDISDYLHKLRTGNDASVEAARVQGHLDRLERGKRSETQTPARETAWGTATKPTETAVQEDMFADTELHGTIFGSYAEFENYLAGDAVKELRSTLGRTLSTAARLQRDLAPLEAKLVQLRAYLANAQEVQAFTIGAGDASVAAAQAKQQAAAEALRKAVADIEAQLDPQRNALQQAMLDVYNAQAAQAKISDAIAKNTAKFNRDPGIQAAAAKVAAAQEAHAAALKRATNTGKADYAEMTRLYNASVAAINEQRTMLEAYAKDSRKIQERSILAYLNRDLQLVLRLRDAEQTVEKARGEVEAARTALDEAHAALQALPETQQALQGAKQAEATSRGVLTKARNRAMNARVRDTEMVAERSDELRAAQAEVAAAKAPTEEAQRQAARAAAAPQENQTDREERDAAQRKAENAQAERIAAIPGVQVTHENVRKTLDEAARLPERIKALDAAAADETASQAARNKAKYEARDARERAKVLYGIISSDPKMAEAAKAALNIRIAATQEKIGAKQIAVNEPGKAASTIRSRRKELVDLRSELKELNRLRKIATQRATFAPVGPNKMNSRALADQLESVQDRLRTEEDANRKAALQKQADNLQAELDRRDEAEQRLTLERGINLETEGTTGTLPARTIGPLVKKAVQAGPIRTGDTSTVGERMSGASNKPQQGGKKRGITGAQAVKQSAKDVAHEQALLKLSEIEDLQERNDAALAKARADGDKAKIAKYEAFATRLKDGLMRAQKRVDETVSTAADVSVLDDTVAPEAPSQFRSERQTTEVDDDIVIAVQDGRVLDAAKLLAARGSTPEVRARAAKLVPLLMRTKIKVDADVQVDGKSVAGKFDPSTNTITMHPGGINEEDLLHEMTHAATDRTLLAPDNTLTEDQRAAKRELEALRVMITASPKFDNEDIGNVREFAAEVFSNESLRTKMDSLGKPVTLWQRFKNLVSRLLGWGSPNSPLSKKAEELVERIMQPSRSISDAEAKNLAPAPSQWRGQQAVDYGYLTGSPLANLRRVEPDKRSLKERITDDAAMRAEYNFADMHNYVVAAMREVGGHIGNQAEFDIRAAGSPSMLAESFIQHGAPEFYADSKGYTAIRASTKNKGSDFFEAVRALPGKDAQAKFELMTNYMMALRGLRVGPEKVAPGMTRAQLQTVVDQVRNDPKLSVAMENARTKYNAYNDRLVDMAVKAGAISAKEGKRMTEHGDYVPMYREHEGKLQASIDGKYETIGDIAHTPYMHALKGGEERVLPINETIFMNTELLTKMALVNSAKTNIGKALAQVGKPSGKMQVGEGTGPAKTSNLTWKEDGKDYHLILDTEGTPLAGIPTAMLAQSIDGYHATLPQSLLWMQKANDYLRAGVTRMPLYTLRQLIKDPASAAIIRGMEGGPLAAVARAFKEFGKVMVGKSADMDKMSRMGLVQNSMFTGNPDDMQMLARQMAGGDAPSAIRTLLNFLDKSASAANATTQLQLFNDGIKKGMSEVEALHHAREAMNFHKRGASATVQQMNRTLVFFNSGIQALNVLQNTLRGKMPFEERLHTKQKFINNSMMLFAAGFLYAAGMGDDDKYNKLKLHDKLGNLHIPFGDTYIKLPIAYFETGGAMWAAGQALAAMSREETEGSDVLKAMGQYALTAVPGGGGLPIGPGLKQIGEWATNKDFNTFRDIVPAKLAGLAPEQQVSSDVPEGMRLTANALGVSPIKFKHAFDSLFGSAASAGLQALDQVTDLGDTAKPARGLEETPFIGGLFQKNFSDQALDAMYAAANDATSVKKTLDHMKSTGQSGDAIRAYIEDNKDALATEKLTSGFTQAMAKLTKAISSIEQSDMPAADKKTAIDKLKQQKVDIAETMNKSRLKMVRSAERDA